MKRREFLKRTGQAVMLAALPVAMLTVASPRIEGARTRSIEELIRESLARDTKEAMDNAAFEQMHRGTKLMSGEYGHYESVRFYESPMLVDETGAVLL